MKTLILTTRSTHNLISLQMRNSYIIRVAKLERKLHLLCEYNKCFCPLQQGAELPFTHAGC